MNPDLIIFSQKKAKGAKQAAMRTCRLSVGARRGMEELSKGTESGKKIFFFAAVSPGRTHGCLSHAILWHPIGLCKMEPEEFDAEQVTKFWMTESEEALQVAEHLMEKADFSYALFFGHLAAEKMLKALHANILHRHAPPVHNLIRLARALQLDLDETRVEKLVTITAFNIEARYPDFKRSFREKCTAEYAQGQMAIIRETHTWLKSQLT